MCGIAGFIDTTQSLGNERLKAIASAMADTLRHRGPDAGGSWVDERAGIALGHRRLSILDLSQEGDQPMFSSRQQYVIVFNGEIYNFEDIRKEIEDGATVRWRGHSDTEVMLAAFERWGIEAAVKRLVGMFSFALWDRKERVLWLVRDRLGEKPLYYGWMGKTFLFGSELKAVVAHPEFTGDVDRDVLTVYLRHNYIPAPYCIYRGISKLLPGSLLKVSLDSAGPGRSLIPTSYWSVREAAETGAACPFKGSEAEAREHLDALLRKTIKDQMVADVPLGAFLSGGVDSSTVVALMQAQSARPVKTFTIGFHEKSYNEAENAASVASHLKTEHRELYVSSSDALAVIPRLPILYDEPFSDSSQIPTFLVSEMTRRYVTVSLSGDGGDELFGGYTRYLWASKIWRNIGWVPVSARRAIASGLGRISSRQWNSTMLSRLLRQPRLADRASKLAEILSVPSMNGLYFLLVSHWTDPEHLVAGAHEPATALTDQSRWANLPDFESHMMYLDSISYLPDDIMQKVDRAGMAVSLESRTPFLDHRVVEFAWQLPIHMKIRRGESKRLLRQVLYQYVPKELIERPKMGFGVPIDSWLRGPLRDWAEALLDEKRLKAEGFFYSEPIRQKWKEHVSGDRNWQYHLWDILMFQSWLDCWKMGAGTKPRDYMLA
jgi:asparagine synthase (glutamine-hydrolysing)